MVIMGASFLVFIQIIILFLIIFYFGFSYNLMSSYVDILKVVYYFKATYKYIIIINNYT
jgi:hypothetical protein